MIQFLKHQEPTHSAFHYTTVTRNHDMYQKLDKNLCIGHQPSNKSIPGWFLAAVLQLQLNLNIRQDSVKYQSLHPVQGQFLPQGATSGFLQQHPPPNHQVFLSHNDTQRLFQALKQKGANANFDRLFATSCTLSLPESFK